MRWALEIIASISLVALLALPMMHYSSLPEQIPTHFGRSGQVDNWGEKSAIWQLPLVGLALFAGLSIVAMLVRRKARIGSGGEGGTQLGDLESNLVTALKAQVSLVFAYIVWVTIETAHGRAEGLGQAFLPVVVAVSVATIGFYVIRRSQLR